MFVRRRLASNSPRDGMLLTDGQGQAGMVQGVGVALTDSNGADLPFAKERADATLTYILQYN
ncbi:hypothetical protein WL39_06175 [Burkholderia ubonensis]|nr:hypothetical protein WL39_06175 [Burkholderia ubonensis]KWB71972.1 hypothetical protein WL38_04210 [Burkholderia ubonensis]